MDQGNSITDVIVVGAGITGISCARLLAQAGRRVLVLDKGRRIGGRMATRRLPDRMILDHGAQYLRPRTPGFAALLAEAGSHAAPWPLDDGVVHVGQPGMSGLVRHLAEGLEVRQSAQVTALAPLDDGWRVMLGDQAVDARHLVLTIPPAQARALLGADHALADALSRVAMLPSITLMAVLDRAAARPFVTRKGEGALAWIAQDSAKPGRPQDGPTGWVVQSDPAFSAVHIDLPFDALAAMLAPMLLKAIGAQPEHLLQAVAHRWLYAQVDVPLGQPFLRQGALWVGGDWCLGPRAEDGFHSGQAIAQDLLART
ncbi:NAD(P)/FAD-dependent oxidoreductase [Paracoccus sp. (in: a-proteobacteria)]|uniref:NAD(P)/FAD-dependent oxidoreductase n=1 Tax=Paracoccus sp. TaxID=267 RepID=UPI00272C0879|nr:FAD-dependent oxidoreductase [Paracoccus sp. (in: a-proteobacteria)]